MASVKKGFMYFPDCDRSSNDQIWFRFMLHQIALVEIKIYKVGLLDTLKKTISLNSGLPAGFYVTRGKALFWDTKDEGGDPVDSGAYRADFYLSNIGVYEYVLQNKSSFYIQ